MGSSPDPSVDVLTCPSCDFRLSSADETLTCSRCDATVPVEDGIPQFPVEADARRSEQVFDVLSSVYETPLWFPPLYRLLVGSPSPPDDRALVAELLDSEGSVQTDRPVLDVACGTGRFTRYVARERRFAWGIDVSAGMLRRARRYTDRDNVAYARMDASRLQFETDSVGAASCLWAVHLFDNLSGVLEEVHRVIEPGGRLAGATVTDEAVLASPVFSVPLRTVLGGRTVNGETFAQQLRENGFTDVTLDRRGSALFFGAVA